MRIEVFDETLPGGARTGAGVMVDIASEAFTLRDLIRSRVRQEVERHNQHPTEVFEGLVQPEQSERILNSGSSAGRGFAMRTAKALDWEAQFQTACASFERNGFLVLVDDEQVADLDETLRLTEDSKVSFVKLTPLIGG